MPSVSPAKPSPCGLTVKLHAEVSSRSVKRPTSFDRTVIDGSKWGMYVK